MDSQEMAHRLSLNPYNFPGIDAAPPMSPLDWHAARFEAEGRAGYPHSRNPYNAGTMACDRWARGWHHADNAFCREKMSKVQRRQWSLRDSSLDTLWVILDAAACKCGYQTRADVPSSIRSYMFDKLDALHRTDARFALHRGHVIPNTLTR